MPTHFRRGKYRDEHRVIAPCLESIERSYDVLLAFGDSDSARFFSLDDHEAAWKRGMHDEAALHLFWDAYNWLKFFWWTSTFKARQLIDGLIHSYNTDNHLAWLVLARSSLEYSAVTHYFAKQMVVLRLQGPTYEVSQLQALDDLMIRYAHGTRFDWSVLMSGDVERLKPKFEAPEATRAVNVLTAISHLARRDSRYAEVEKAYEMLSDFAHPNMASHSAVTEMPSDVDPRHTVRFAARPQALRGEFIAVVSLPWVSTAVGTIVEVLVEIAPLLDAWLGHVDQGAKVTIDLTR